MTVTPTSSATTPTTSTTGTSSTDAMSQLSGNFSTFLTLLTTQLKNQDPTSPMDSNQFTQQLVMYSQVEQQIQSNTNLKTLISQGTSNAASMTNSYLGKKVSVTNGEASLSGGTANWTYNLATATAATQLTVTANDTAGNAVTSSVASAGTVTQIDMTSGTPQLVIGNMEVSLADIAAVAN